MLFDTIASIATPLPALRGSKGHCVLARRLTGSASRTMAARWRAEQEGGRARQPDEDRVPGQDCEEAEVARACLLRLRRGDAPVAGSQRPVPVPVRDRALDLDAA